MGENIEISSAAKYLGIWIDDNLSMTKQINNVCSQGYRTLKNLWQISSKINNIQLKIQLIHSCLLSKLNYCSVLYHSLPKKEQFKLDKLLKSSVRFIFRIVGRDRRNPITPFLQKLHFLPIVYRSEFKLNLLIYKCFNNQAPDYLKNLLLPRLNDSKVVTRKDKDTSWLNYHLIEKLVYKNRGFRHAAPKAWNGLSQSIRESDSTEILKMRLKTFYYDIWLNS